MSRAARPRPLRKRRTRASRPPARRTRLRPSLRPRRPLARRSCAGGVGGPRLFVPARVRVFAVRAASAKDEEDETADDDEEAYELRGRESGHACQSGDVAARVVADELDEETNQSVEHCVGGDDLAREALATVQPKEEEEEQKGGERLVELRRVQMQGRSARVRRRHARDRVSQFGEVNAPRQSGRLAPAAARCEAALTTDCLPQRHARRERVRHLPERKFVTTYQERARQKPAEEAAVPNAART